MEIIQEYWLLLISILAVFVEVTPIKINPLSTLGRFVGNLLGIKEINEKISNLETRIDWNDIYIVKHRIIDFDIRVRKDVNNDMIERYEYKAIFKDIQKWIDYHKKYEDLNGEIDIAIDNVKEAFKKAKFSD